MSKYRSLDPTAIIRTVESPSLRIGERFPGSGMSSERRVKRRRVLSAIQELRALAHVIDMHQLSKDPQRVLEPRFLTTASSPNEPMGGFELARYLDYCTEMFSLTGKLATVYAAGQDDPAVIAAVNEVEGLTTGLSRKVWQKIMVLQSGLSAG